MMNQVKLFLIVLLLAMGSVVNAQTKSQIRAILEQFYVENYDSYFSPRQYVEGTLVITSVEVDERNGKIKIRGTHTCRGRYIPFIGRRTYSGREYKAELIFSIIGVKVRFWRWYNSDFGESNAHWEGPCEKLVLPE